MQQSDTVEKNCAGIQNLLSSASNKENSPQGDMVVKIEMIQFCRQGST